MNALIERRDSTTEGWWNDTLRALVTSRVVHSGPRWVTAPSASTRATPQEIGRPLRRFPELSPTFDGGTGRVEDFRAIADAVALLGDLVAPGELEYGMETPLIPTLYRLVRANGEGAVLELAASIESKEMDPQIASWILRWLGRLPHHATHHARRWLLERGLRSPVPMVRDGAALGLASMGDSRALPALQGAAQRERYSRLRRNMEKAIRQVQRSA
jgi:HEAT repeats